MLKKKRTHAQKQVAADARLLSLKTTTFGCEEGSLTGESVAVSKSIDPVAADSTIAVSGVIAGRAGQGQGRMCVCVCVFSRRRDFWFNRELPVVVQRACTLSCSLASKQSFICGHGVRTERARAKV